MNQNTIKAGDYLSPYHLKYWNIATDAAYQIEMIQADRLLSASRLDLACKLYYIDCLEKGRDMTFAKDLYKEHIKAFSSGSFVEPGSYEKNTIGSYYASFDRMIEDIKHNGIDPARSVIPVNEDYELLDGSHRAAIAIYYHISVPVIKISTDFKGYGYSFFAKNGLEQRYIDFMVSQYMKYRQDIYTVFCWPRAEDPAGLKQAESLICSRSNVVYKKELYLNYNGLKQLMIHLYHEQGWCGNPENQFSGIDSKAEPCYKSGKPAHVYIIEGISFDQVLLLKQDIRDIFKVENHSIHITDNAEESFEAAKLILNDNSLFYLNYGNPFKYKALFIDLDEFRKYEEYLPKSEKDCMMDSEAVFKLYGYAVDAQFRHPTKESSHNDPLDPAQYYYYFGIKFPTMEYYQKAAPNPGSRKLAGKIYRKMKMQARLHPPVGGCKMYLPHVTSVRLKNPIKSIKESFFSSYCGRKLLSAYRFKRYGSQTAGSNGESIQDLEKVFTGLDPHCEYLIMRNWEGFYNDILMEGHNDIDVLCGDPYSRYMLAGKLHASPVTNDGYHYVFDYRGREVSLDVRMAGDGYYDYKWQKDMLRHRVLHPLGFYIMDHENYFYSLAYHAIYQKKDGVSDEYMNKLYLMNPGIRGMQQGQLIDMLHKYMKKKHYKYTVTADQSVVKVFSRVPDQKMVRYPLMIRLHHQIMHLKEKQYLSRIKVFIRRLLIK